jgi:hypothetical protein
MTLDSANAIDIYLLARHSFQSSDYALISTQMSKDSPNPPKESPYAANNRQKPSYYFQTVVNRRIKMGPTDRHNFLIVSFGVKAISKSAYK